ncbi:MAG: hypothetical protein WA906_04365 [Pacificimonas sp.]
MDRTGALRTLTAIAVLASSASIGMAQESAAPADVIQEDVFAPVTTDEELAEEATGGRTDTASETLYRMLQNDENGADVNRALAAVLTELNVDCPAIERFQRFSFTSTFVSLKVKCSERALYALTLGPIGLGVVSGGDGSIERMDPDDGDIRNVNGEAPRLARPTRIRGPLIDVQTLLIAGGIVFAGLIALILYFRRRAKIIAPWKGLRSEDKDRLLLESDEVDDDVFTHPSGMWLARGSRGKRRLFRNRLFAYLYARHGLKLFQVR